MAHKADSIKEPSYNTLANIAEVLGAVIYNSPALASTNKLDEAIKPDEPTLDMGIVTNSVNEDNKHIVYSVKLNSGTVINASSLTGKIYKDGYEVVVMQNNTGDYFIISGGDEDGTSEYGNQIWMKAASYGYFITDTGGNLHINNRFQAFDTNSLINLILELHYHITNIESRFNNHIHTVPNGKSGTPEINPALSTEAIRKLAPYDEKDFQDRYNVYSKSHTPKFEIIY